MILVASGVDIVLVEVLQVCFQIWERADGKICCVEICRGILSHVFQWLVIVDEDKGIIASVLHALAFAACFACQPICIKRGAGHGVEVPSGLVHLAKQLQQW